MIDTGDAIVGQDLCEQRPESALHPVADNGIADFLGDGDAVPDPFRWNGMIGAAPMRQQDKAVGDESLAAIGGKKIRTFANHFDRMTGIGASRIGRRLFLVQGIRQ